MASKPDLEKYKCTPSGEFWVIIERDGIKQFIEYQSQRRKFAFRSQYNYLTRYYKDEAETIVKMLEQLRDRDEIQFKQVYIREISYRKKKRVESARAHYIFPKESEIESYFYKSPTKLVEVKRMDEKGLAKVNKTGYKMVTPKAGSVIVDKDAIKKTVNNGVPAESPKQIFEFVMKPYTTVKAMPLEYVYNQTMKYFNSLVAEVRDKDGKVIDNKWVGIPERRGLALALGCCMDSLDNFITKYERDSKNTDNDDNEEDFLDPDNYSTDMKDIIKSLISSSDNNAVKQQNQSDDNTNSSNVHSPSESNTNQNDTTNNIWYDREKTISQQNSRKRLKYLIIKRALAYIEFYKVKCLYGSSPVGAMFDLKCNYGWIEKQSLTIEAGQSLLGRQKSADELERMAAAVDGGTAAGRRLGVGFDLDGVME